MLFRSYLSVERRDLDKAEESPQLVDFGGRIVGIFLIVHHAFERQAVGQPGRLVGIPHDDGRQRNDALGQFQNVSDLAGSIDRRSEIANAQPLQFGLDAQVLGGEQGIGRGIEEPREIVIGRVGIALPADRKSVV